MTSVELNIGMMVAVAGALTTELIAGVADTDLVGGVNPTHSITPTLNILRSWSRINRQVVSLGLAADLTLMVVAGESANRTPRTRGLDKQVETSFRNSGNPVCPFR